jgi:DNA-binding SARP family transcriptional activator/tetratricopeptide (TPR) repeat protein
MDFRILGPLEAWDADVRCSLGPPKQRALLARLLIDPGRVVAVDRLVDDLWGEDVPETAPKMVQIFVSQLRKTLPAGTLATRAPGYALELDGHTLDLHRFRELRAHGVAALDGDPGVASDHLRAALELWRGEALAEFSEPFAAMERAAFHEAHLACLEDRVRADLACGRHAELVHELASLTARHPLRQRLHEQLMLALYRSGRQGEALAVFQRFRRRLDEEVGIEPSAELRELQVRMLRQDPALSRSSPRPPRLLPPSTTGRRATAPIGRDPEVELLRSALDSALQGSRGTVFLTGEAGIGKTTLAETLLEHARTRGALTSIAGCAEQHGSREAYMPIFDAVGRLARGDAAEEVERMMASCAPTWLVQMPWLAARSDLADLGTRAIGATPDRMLREMVDLLEGLALQRPIVLVLEDLHWSDLSTIDLVTALARRFEPAALLLVVTYRSAEAGAAGHPLRRTARELRLRGHALEIALAPLSEHAVRAYLAERSVPGVTERVVGALTGRTRGNPLFLEQVVDAWQEAGDADAGALLDRMPETLRDLVETQLMALSEAERDALETASVVGVEGAGAAVAAGCGRSADDVEALLERLAERGAFVECLDEERWPDGTQTGRYRFLHDVSQEAIYARIAPARRSRLHRRIGTRLEDAHGDRAEEIAAQLASHFVHGGDAVRGVHHLGHAAEQAFGRVAPRDALVHVERALELLPALPLELRDRAELGLRTLQGPALVAVHGWDHDGAERAFERARELCETLGPLEELQWALFRLATFYEVRGEYVRSEALLAKSFALPVESDRVGLLVDSHELMACTLFHQGEFSPALEHADRTLGLYDGRYSNPLTAAYGDNPGVAAHCWAALSLWFLGFADQARARALESVEMARNPLRASGLSTACAQAAVVAQLRRDPQETLRWADEAIEHAGRAGYRYRAGMGRLLRGWALVELRREDEGLAEIETGLAQARATGVRMEDPYFLGVKADACLATGIVDDGLAAVREGLAIREGDRSFFYEPELHRIEGELLEDDVAAVECFARALDTARGSPALELRAAVSLARARPADATRASLADARAAITEGLDGRDVQDADALLARLGALS